MILRFKINNEPCSLEFYYTYVQNSLGKTVERTFLRITLINSGDTLYKGDITRHGRDPLNRDTAHKILFAKFLHSEGFSKSVRKHLWQKFFSAQTLYKSLHQW